MVSWPCGARGASSAAIMISHMIQMMRSIHPTRMGNDSLYLARLMRPPKEKRYQFQSMRPSPEGGAARAPDYCRPWRGPGSVPQQLVDAGLGAGALVDAFHDDGAGRRGTRLAVFQRFSGQG